MAFLGMSSTVSIMPARNSRSDALQGANVDPAVAEQRRGDAVPGHRRNLRIPANLRVQMRVQIDESRRHVEAIGTNLLAPLAVNLANLDDGVAINRHVRRHRRAARTIHPASRLELPDR